MRICFTIALLLAAASVVLGQLESDTLTIQASRSVNLQPDQAVLYVTVNSSLSMSLDETLAALQGSGITAASFSNVYDAGQDLPRLQWWFTLAVPFTKMKATLATLAAIQQLLGKGGLQMNLSISSQFSPELLASQVCSLKDLVADARAQAQSMAAAGGFVVGEMSSLSDRGSGVIASFVSIPNYVDAFFNPYFALPSACFAEVKFKLLRYQ